MLRICLFIFVRTHKREMQHKKFQEEEGNTLNNTAKKKKPVWLVPGLARRDSTQKRRFLAWGLEAAKPWRFSVLRKGGRERESWSSYEALCNYHGWRQGLIEIWHIWRRGALSLILLDHHIKRSREYEVGRRQEVSSSSSRGRQTLLDTWTVFVCVLSEPSSGYDVSGPVMIRPSR